MSKFLAKRHKFQSTKEVDFRRRKAEREAGVGGLDMYSPRPHQREFINAFQRESRFHRAPPASYSFFMGGDFVDGEYKLDARHRRGPIPYNSVVDLEIDVHLRSDPHNFRTGLEGSFTQRPHVTFLNNREYWIDAIVEPGIAVARRDSTDGEFLGRGDEERKPCPNCGRVHPSFHDWFAEYHERTVGRIADLLRDHLAIPGEAVRVQEHNLLPHHKDL